jgi:VanZ family protein
LRGSRKWIDPALWAASWFLLGLVVLLSLVPESPVQMRDGVDKLAHGCAYGALTLSFLLAGVWRPVRGRGRYPMGAIWIVIAAVGIGVVIEIIQDIESYRSMDAFDAVADAVGAAIGASLWMILRFVTRNSTYRSPSPSR